MVITKNKDSEEKELRTSFKQLDEIMEADEILEREIVKIGNGAHINIPLKHLGKTAKVIIRKREQEHIGYDSKGNKVFRPKLDFITKKKEDVKS